MLLPGSAGRSRPAFVSAYPVAGQATWCPAIRGNARSSKKSPHRWMGPPFFLKLTAASRMWVPYAFAVCAQGWVAVISTCQTGTASRWQLPLALFRRMASEAGSHRGTHPFAKKRERVGHPVLSRGKEKPRKRWAIRLKVTHAFNRPDSGLFRLVTICACANF